jgi:hypothetical protein
MFLPPRLMAFEGGFHLMLQVRLRVPEITVAMDAKEFEILQDVAAHLSAAQVRAPTLPPALCRGILLWSSQRHRACHCS